MDFGELFDGEQWWLDPGDWALPWLVPGEPVELEVQIPPLDELESPEVNYAPREDQKVSIAWAVEQGWSALAVDLQYVGELLTPHGETNLLEVEQLVARDDKWNVTSKHHRVEWMGAVLPEGI